MACSYDDDYDVSLKFSLSFSLGHCPVYNSNAKKMDSKKCFGSNCPLEVYLSDDVYKCMYIFKSLTDKLYLQSLFFIISFKKKIIDLIDNLTHYHLYTQTKC